MSILLALLTTLAASAATQLDCVDRAHGYRATVKHLTTATVERRTIAGMRFVAKLGCTMPHGFPRPDRPHLVAVCYDKALGGDWMLSIEAGANGATSAIFKKNDGRDDSQPIATLDCRAR